MTWELIRIKADSQESSQESFVFLHKSVQRAGKDSVNAFQYLVQLHPLPILESTPTSKTLITIEPAKFKVIADLDEQKILFDIASADAALPTILRSKGLGAIAVSELILWCQKHYPTFAIATTHVSAALLNYSNGASIAARFLNNFQFNVGKSPKGGLQFNADNAQSLKTHINQNKLESVNPTQWGSQLLKDNLNASNQIRDLNQNITTLKEQLFQTSHQTQSSLPFLSGLLAGFVAGAAIAALIFTAS